MWIFKKKYNKEKGFTIIELLVVIAVIGLLSAIVFASLNSARVKARDVRRKADLHSLELAIQLYYDSTGAWPNTDGSIDNNTTRAGDWPQTFKDRLAPYISNLPLDPLENTARRFYGAQPMTWSPDPTCNGQYVLWMYLENSGDPNWGKYSCGSAPLHYFRKLGPS